MPRVKKPRRPVPKRFPLRFPDIKPHEVADGDSWKSLATKYRIDAKNIVWINFRTSRPAEINWHLKNYVGCTKSNDGKNYSFSSNDKPGVIWIPTRLIGTAKAPPSKEEPQDFRRFVSDKCTSKRYTCLSEAGIREFSKGAKNSTFTHRRGMYDMTFRRGDVYKTMDGQRIVVKAGYHMIFLMNGHYYMQDGRDFMEDVVMDAVIDGFQRAKGMMRLAEVEMAFFMGLAGAAAGGAGFIAVTTVSVGKFLQKHDIGKLAKQIAAFWIARAVLKKVAPTLYDKLFWGTMKLVLKRLPRSVNELSAEDIAGLIGGIVGKLGINAVETTLKQVFTITVELIKFMITKLPVNAGLLLVKDYTKLAQQFQEAFKRMKIHLSNRDAMKIVKEVYDNYDVVKKTLSELAWAFK